MFTFYSDMEWDFGLPWYRPTRICHVTSGSEFGWRTGNGKLDPALPDNLPPVVNIGPGSPTSVLHARNAKFPENYRKRSEEHTSELQSLMRTSYAVFCLKQKTQPQL